MNDDKELKELEELRLEILKTKRELREQNKHLEQAIKERELRQAYQNLPIWKLILGRLGWIEIPKA